MYKAGTIPRDPGGLAVIVTARDIFIGFLLDRGPTQKKARVAVDLERGALPRGGDGSSTRSAGRQR
jgi:hypothetical protein